MTLQELIELAILDAMGLLDEQEQAQFETAFRAAAPAVQAQVRREQTRLSRLDSLLPEVVPPAGLRAAVLQRVREEIALVGLDDETERGPILPPLLGAQAVSHWWRAASFGLAAAALLLGLSTFLFHVQHQRALDELQSDAMHAAMIDQFGRNYVVDVIFKRDTERVIFAPADESFRGEVSLFINPEWRQAQLFCQGVPEGRYRLVVIDDNDQIIEPLRTFESDGKLSNFTVAMTPVLLTGTLAIISDEPGVRGMDHPVILGRAIARG